jgi:SAM-dependent methyltransferase
MTGPSEPNRDQAALWNARAGSIWVEMQETIDRLFAPIEAEVVEAGFPGEGACVLDIGCGAGATTLAMARRLGPAGCCLGLDISKPLVEAAERRASAAGLGSVRFMAGDAQVHDFWPADFDAAISRFGVMFFEDPAAAFANIRRALRPDGKLAFAAWRSPAENPFMTAAARAAAPLLPDLPTAAPDGPGQFGFADPGRVRRILGDAGWSAVEVRPLDVEAALEEPTLAAYAEQMGPVGLALQGLDEATRAPIRQAVRRGFDPFVRDGVARFNMACWLVTARA